MAATQDVKGKGEGGDQNFDYMFKLLIIGNSSVGKTSFLFRYADDAFTSAFVSTVGIDFKVKTVYKNDKRIKLQIWVWNIKILSIKHLKVSPKFVLFVTKTEVGRSCQIYAISVFTAFSDWSTPDNNIFVSGRVSLLILIILFKKPKSGFVSLSLIMVI